MPFGKGLCMRAFMIEETKFADLIEAEEPRITGPTEVKVEVESVGICGTDIKIYEGHHSQSLGQKQIPGHEFAGVVTEVGSRVRSLKVGDRVVHEPISYCGSCYACRRGEGNVCADVRVTGCNCSGGMEEYFVAEERQWHKIPDWITWNQAALIEPYTIAAQVCARAELQPEDTMLIYGAGPIGLMLADTALHMGVRVFISEISEGRLALAGKIGIPHVIDSGKQDVRGEMMELTGGYGPNIVADCAGVPKLAEEGMELLSPCGRFVPVAGVKFTFDGYMAMRRQIKIVASRLQMHQFVPVIARFRLYQEHADAMITDVFDFQDTKEAFRLAAERRPETGKIVLRFHKYN